MEGRSDNHGTLSLRWIWLAWFAPVFTALGFLIFGVVSRGDPTPMIERLFGDTAQVAFLVYTVGQGVAALVLIGPGLRYTSSWERSFSPVSMSSSATSMPVC